MNHAKFCSPIVWRMKRSSPRRLLLAGLTVLMLETFSASNAWAPPPPYRHFERVDPNREIPPGGPPWFDFDHFELEFLGGAVIFSSDFDSNMQGVGAALAHLPTPGLPVPGADHLGLYAEFLGAPVERLTAVPVPEPSGTMILGGGGLEYTFYRDKDMTFSAQAGFLYADFGGVTDLESGVGPAMGFECSFYVDEPIWITYSPRFAYAPAHEDWMMFQMIGLRIEF